jgi:hypothetical protein
LRAAHSPSCTTTPPRALQQNRNGSYAAPVAIALSCPSTTTAASQHPARRFAPAVSHARSCAILRRVLSVCASLDTRTMSPASSRRAADAAPFARRRTRAPSRTGSAESRRSRKEQEAQHGSAWEANVCTSGSVTAWESENDEPFAEMLEDVIHALDRLGRRNMGEKRAGRSPISV